MGWGVALVFQPKQIGFMPLPAKAGVFFFQGVFPWAIVIHGGGYLAFSIISATQTPIWALASLLASLCEEGDPSQQE